MERFPLTVNGKLDRRALPDADLGTSGEDYVAPSTELEEAMCVIWSEILGLTSDQISIHQNFFRMGGNSILSIQLKNRLSQRAEFKNISIADLFKYNTIYKLIESIGQKSRAIYKLQNHESRGDSHEIAIIGASGAFSGVNSIAELWDLIAHQQEGIQFYKEEECRRLQVDESLLQHPDYVPVSGKVPGIELFDPLFWGLSPNEAKHLSPQIRKFIEHCWFALESSGYARQRREHNIGVFAGSGDEDYLYGHILNGIMGEQVNLWEASVSNSKDALATKTAFLLGLTGPANSINTACSTGLVSVVEACKNLRLGICDMALAGGVSFSMPDQIGHIYEEGMIASKDGHCRTFDQDASGTTVGSGVGVVLLKRLGDAIKDRDPILGVIKGYTTNNDGDRKTGYTAPSVIGQSECIINAQRMAGVTSDQIEYIECHGTATYLGDPIEVQALREAFAYNRSEEKGINPRTVLGAVKANIGHANSAAGIAGLIKVCAMLSNQMMPGQVNFEVPNAELQLDQTSFEIIKENRAWPSREDKQRLAGVSSFGIGGTNAHVIIGDYISPAPPEQKNTYTSGGSGYIVAISAKSRQSLDRYRQSLLEACQNDTSLNIRDISYTLQERREHFSYRSAYRADSIDDLISKLNENTSYGQANTEETNKVVFMFPGQGAQYICMAKALYDEEPFFKASIDRCIVLANQHIEIDLYKVMYPEESIPLYDINDTQWSQISLFIIEYALAQYLEELGIKADAYIGHSIGEYVAATLSGVFTLNEGIKIVISRGRLMQSMEPGSMLAINAREEIIKAMVEEHNCEIAVINSIEDIVASGRTKDIHMLQEALEKQSISNTKLTTSHAYHSRLMEVAAREFKESFKGIKLNKPTKEFISNLTGELVNEEEVSTVDYWCRQLRDTVQFSKGIGTLSGQYNHRVTFVELGPGKGLSYFVNKHKSANGHKSVHTSQLLPSAKEAELFYQPIKNKEDLKARLWVSGLTQSPDETRPFRQAKLLSHLPVYQFDHQQYWLEKGKKDASANGLQLLPKEKWLSVPIWSAIFNLHKQVKKSKPIFKNALLILRKDQLDLLDFALLVQEIQFIVLDTDESNTSDMGSALIRVNPENEHHFEELVKYLKVKETTFDVIIHAASINNVADLGNALHNSFYSLFLIRQHLVNYSEKLLILTNGLAQITNEDIIHPSNGTLVGAIRNINHEFLKIDARIIDIGYNLQNIASGIAQVWNQKAYQKSEELLAIRFGKLWTERFESIDNPVSEESNIEDGDIILITGGLGGVGLAIAEHISSKHKVKLILTSRKNIFDNKNKSDANDHKKQIIKKIIAGGSIVDIQYADISAQVEVDAIIDKVNKTYGKVTGIIHTAGVVPLERNNYNLENIKEAFKGKVFGIDNIINTIDLNHVKFIACTSSLASIMGDVNRIEYCAANSYLDYLSADKLKFSNIKLLSTNWNAWQDKPIEKQLLPYQQSENINPIKDLNRLMYSNGASHEENAELFCRLIGQSSYEQVAISRFDISKLIQRLFGQDHSQSIKSRTVLIENDLPEQAYQIGQIYGDLLGLEEISVHDDFFRIGGNSILAIQLSHRLSKALGSEIRVADIFKHKTIS
ncbi:type I polyketide synthase, partial [Mucilaginibacter lappiensis]